LGTDFITKLLLVCVSVGILFVFCLKSFFRIFTQDVLWCYTILYKSCRFETTWSGLFYQIICMVFWV